VDEKIFRRIVISTSMQAAFVQPKYAHNAARWTDGELEIICTADTRISVFPPLPRQTEPDDLAVLAFTSGSTGAPKAVMVTHENLCVNTADIAAYLELTPQDRAMAVLPMSYCFGASVLHSHLRAGASMVLSGSFMFPERVLDEMRTQECTNFAGAKLALRGDPFRHCACCNRPVGSFRNRPSPNSRRPTRTSSCL
jgi:long-subunit acyl-CoA synthetase (AMP-forming)